MNKNNVYTVQFRRKREGFTNYRKRLKILASNRPRLVVRKTLRNIQAAIAEYNSKGDMVKVATHSSQLKKFGWVYGNGNLPAAYLTGFLLGKKAKRAKIENAILDIGLNKSVKGAKVYAVLAGALDAGLTIPCNKEILPEKGRMSGKHISDYALKLNNANVQNQFSSYSKNNINLTNITKNFEDTKKSIESNI